MRNGLGCARAVAPTEGGRWTAAVLVLQQQRHAREGPTARLAAVLLDVRVRL